MSSWRNISEQMLMERRDGDKNQEHRPDTGSDLTNSRRKFPRAEEMCDFKDFVVVSFTEFWMG